MAFVLLSAAAGTGSLQGTDSLLIQAAQSRPSFFLDVIARLCSALGGLELTVIFLFALVTGLFLRGRRRLAGRLLLAFLITGLLEYLLKQFLPVPPVPPDFVRIGDSVQVVAVDYSYPYPSGHALRSTILLGATYLLSRNRALRAGVTLALLALLVSRVYVGVHWPSDVAGGALLGVVAVVWAFGKEDQGKDE
jgi:undecaprenyl-diphosphatase